MMAIMPLRLDIPYSPLLNLQTGLGKSNREISLDDFVKRGYICLETNTNELIFFTPHPPLPLKGGGLGRG
jgi:hypothetical protein